MSLCALLTVEEIEKCKDAHYNEFGIFLTENEPRSELKCKKRFTRAVLVGRGHAERDPRREAWWHGEAACSAFGRPSSRAAAWTCADGDGDDDGAYPRRRCGWRNESAVRARASQGGEGWLRHDAGVVGGIGTKFPGNRNPGG